MKLSTLIAEKREQILEAASKHGAYNVRIFGSVARGVAAGDSDVDILVDLKPGRTLFDLGSLLIELQRILGCDVDLLTEGSLHWYIRDRVLEEAVPL